MAIDTSALDRAVNDAIAALTRVAREIAAVNNPTVSGDYSDLGMLTRGIQPGSPEAETEAPAPSAVTHGAATFNEASGGKLDNEGNPTSPAKPATTPANKPADK